MTETHKTPRCKAVRLAVAKPCPRPPLPGKEICALCAQVVTRDMERVKVAWGM